MSLVTFVFKLYNCNHVCVSVLQIDYILPHYGANPKVQQTHTTSAQMMNLFMKSK